jgi:microsomal epoxide hydrolase
MSVPYSLIPRNAEVKPSKFTLSVSENQLDEFKILLKLSKIGPITYEGVQQDRKYGITHEWLKNAKEYWEKTFDW